MLRKEKEKINANLQKKNESFKFYNFLFYKFYYFCYLEKKNNNNGNLERKIEKFTYFLLHKS